MSAPAPASAKRPANQTKAKMAKGQRKRSSVKLVDPNPGASFISGFSAGTTTLVTMSKDDCTGSSKRSSVKLVDPNPGASFISGLSAGTTTLVTTSKDDCTDSARLDRSDLNPNFPRTGEKPNDLLQRLYSLWPAQLTASYRPPAPDNPEATSEFNLRNLRELYPARRTMNRVRRKTRAAGVALAAIMSLDKKPQYSMSGSRQNLES